MILINEGVGGSGKMRGKIRGNGGGEYLNH